MVNPDGTSSTGFAPAGRPPLTEAEVRRWSSLCHLSALLGLALPSFGSVIGPLVVWLMKRDDHPVIDAHGKEALNFQISLLIYTWVLLVIGFITMFILVGIAFFFLATGVWLVGLVLAVVGAVKASNGSPFRYPFSIRFIS